MVGFPMLYIIYIHLYTHRVHVWYIYANIWGILMVNVSISYIPYMDPMGYPKKIGL
jgi:hypothetical protein